MKTAIWLAEKGYVPEFLLRKGIKRLLEVRLVELQEKFGENPESGINEWLEQMRSSQVALVPEKANEQHYEVPPEFFKLVLGPRLKYSSAYYPEGCTSLEEAEEAMLGITCERARLADGMDILEMGCGWGSLSLWMAEKYPNSRILAVSNSSPQCEYINAQAQERGFKNLRAMVADMNEFKPPEGSPKFNRIVTVEMFEHMRNWEELLTRVASWLA